MATCGVGGLEQVEGESRDGGAVGGHVVKGWGWVGAQVFERQCGQSREEHQVERVRASYNVQRDVAALCPEPFDVVRQDRIFDGLQVGR